MLGLEGFQMYSCVSCHSHQTFKCFPYVILNEEYMFGCGIFSVRWGLNSCIDQINFSVQREQYFLKFWNLNKRIYIICGNKTPTRCNRWFLLQILLLAQHVSGTIMPIMTSSRVLYKWLLPVVFGAWFSSCRYGVELRVVCPVCGHDGHNGARNMLSKQ